MCGWVEFEKEAKDGHYLFNSWQAQCTLLVVLFFWLILRVLTALSGWFPSLWLPYGRCLVTFLSPLPTAERSNSRSQPSLRCLLVVHCQPPAAWILLLGSPHACVNLFFSSLDLQKVDASLPCRGTGCSTDSLPLPRSLNAALFSYLSGNGTNQQGLHSNQVLNGNEKSAFPSWKCSQSLWIIFWEDPLFNSLMCSSPAFPPSNHRWPLSPVYFYRMRGSGWWCCWIMVAGSSKVQLSLFKNHFIEVWLTCKKLYRFNFYYLMSLRIHIQLWNHHHHQGQRLTYSSPLKVSFSSFYSNNYYFFGGRTLKVSLHS